MRGYTPEEAAALTSAPHTDHPDTAVDGLADRGLVRFVTQEGFRVFVNTEAGNVAARMHALRAAGHA